MNMLSGVFMDFYRLFEAGKFLKEGLYRYPGVNLCGRLRGSISRLHDRGVYRRADGRIPRRPERSIYRCNDGSV